MNFRPRPVFVLLFASCLFCCLSLCPRPAHAEMKDRTGLMLAAVIGIPILGLDIGWEDMMLKGNDYQKNNHGLVFTLSAGWNMFPSNIGLLGFQLDQDLGFIELRPR